MKEEKAVLKAIQLTERDSNAVWKTKDHSLILMSDMSEPELQRALIIVQKRKLRSLDMLLLDIKLEEQLNKEAFNRNFPMQNLNEIEDPLAEKFIEMQDLLKTVINSIKRKLKILEKV